MEISFAVGKILLKKSKMPSRISSCIVVLTFVLQQKAWSPKLSMICPQEHIVTSSSGQSSSRSFCLRFISMLSGFWQCAVSILLISSSDLDVLGWRISLSFLLVMVCFVDFFYEFVN